MFQSKRFIILVFGMTLFSQSAHAKGANPEQPPYEGSKDQEAFVEKIQKEPTWQLHLRLRTLGAEVLGVCGGASALVGITAAVESIPIVAGLGAGFADLIDAKYMTELEEERLAKGFGDYTWSGSVLGGVITGAGGTVIAGIKGLRGDKTGYYMSTRGAYRGTAGVTHAFMGEMSFCSRLWSQMSEVKAVLAIHGDAKPDSLVTAAEKQLSETLTAKGIHATTPEEHELNVANFEAKRAQAGAAKTQ